MVYSSLKNFTLLGIILLLLWGKKCKFYEILNFGARVPGTAYKPENFIRIAHIHIPKFRKIYSFLGPTLPSLHF